MDDVVEKIRAEGSRETWSSCSIIRAILWEGEIHVSMGVVLFVEQLESNRCEMLRSQ